MRGRWQVVGIAVLTACGFSACATGEGGQPVGEGGSGGEQWGGGAGGTAGAGGEAGMAGMGGGGAGGGAGGGSSSSSSSSSSTGGSSLCGNGVKDPGEQCDGNDFGGKTCADYGLGGGVLTCNSFCGVVAKSCVPKELCTDFKDNDLDNATDCLDSDCAAELACIDSCYNPTPLSVPGWFSGTTLGRPSVVSASCSSLSGPEAIFRIDANVSGTMTVNVGSWSGADFSVSLRSTCNDATSELACVNKQIANSGNDEILSWDITAGQTYFLVLDGVQGSAGEFYINTNIPQPESWCIDFYDDDSDGYVDCDDATSCQSTFDCMPGFKTVGESCFSNYECAANNNDPACLNTKQAFPDGYCSEWCDIMAQDCPGDAVCADIGLGSVNGVCLDGCVMDSDCRVGYACVDKGLTTKVCMLGPEADCSNNFDDDQDSLADCEDPDCQSTTDCTGGAKAAGQPCLANNECFADGNDPLCLSEFNYNFPGGYCSEYCYFNNDCGPGSICSSWFFFPSGAGTCMRTCMTDSQCRPGYVCLDVGMAQKICVY